MASLQQLLRPSLSSLFAASSHRHSQPQPQPRSISHRASLQNSALNRRQCVAETGIVVPLSVAPSIGPALPAKSEETLSEWERIYLPIEDSIDYLCRKKSILAVQVGAILATAGEAANAVTGENNHEVPLTWILTQLGIVAFFNLILVPPILMNWLRIRWYRRSLLEMYVQFMFVFIFFPGILLWAPFLNFRKLPRDPSMKYPWSTPQDPSQIKNSYLKYPFAKPEDYDW